MFWEKLNYVNLKQTRFQFKKEEVPLKGKFANCIVLQLPSIYDLFEHLFFLLVKLLTLQKLFPFL